MGSTWEKADYPPGHSACRRAGKYGGLALDVLDSIITWERRHTASGMSPPCLKKRSDCEIRPLPQQHSPWQGFHQRMLPAKDFISVISPRDFVWVNAGQRDSLIMQPLFSTKALQRTAF